MTFTLSLKRAAAIAALSVAAALPSGAETVIIHAGKVLDVPGNALRGATTITVTGGKIVSLENGFKAAGRNVRVIDLKDSYVLPGLIDAHVHLTSDSGGIAGQLEEITLSPAAQAFDAWENGMKTLRAGFTTVRNLGDGDGAVLALRDAINDGQIQGPRILDAGNSISVSSGHMDGSLGYRDELRPYFKAAGNTCDGAEDCRRAVRLQVSRGADVIKLATTGGVNSRIGAGLGKQMFEDEAVAIVQTANLFGKKVSAHAHGGDGIRLALEAGMEKDAMSIEFNIVLPTPQSVEKQIAARAKT